MGFVCVRLNLTIAKAVSFSYYRGIMIERSVLRRRNGLIFLQKKGRKSLQAKAVFKIQAERWTYGTDQSQRFDILL